MEEREQLARGDALLIVDVQKDFCRGGSLEVPDGDAVVPVLNRWIDAAIEVGVPIFASRDWHPQDHASFTSRGGPWPPHCVQDTEGARFHPSLVLDDRVIRVSKGTRFDRDAYSAFDNTGLAEYLHRRNIQRLWIGGLALDVCVRHTAQDAVQAGFVTHLIRAATRAVDAAAGNAAVQQLRGAGVVVHEE